MLGAGSNGLALRRRVPRDRLTATTAPERVWDTTPPEIIWSPVPQPRITSTSGVVVHAVHEKVAIGFVVLVLEVAV